MNFSITGASGGNSSSWSGSIFYFDDGHSVKDTYNSQTITVSDPYNLNAQNDPVSLTFDLTEVLGFDGDYVTFRSQNSTDQFPTTQTGYSLDLWSDTLKSDIIDGDISWSSLNGNNYSLSASKYSLVYHYNAPRAIRFSKNGIISFSKQV